MLRFWVVTFSLSVSWTHLFWHLLLRCFFCIGLSVSLSTPRINEIINHTYRNNFYNWKWSCVCSLKSYTNILFLVRFTCKYFWVIGFLYYSDIHIPVYLRRKLRSVLEKILEIKVQSHLIIWMSAGGKGHLLIAEQVP